MNVMMLSFALYSGFFTEFSPETIQKLSWPTFVLASVVLLYGGRNIYRRAWAGIFSAAFSMETLITVGSFSAYFYSIYGLLSGSIHLYFDTASMLITLVLLGKLLERRAKAEVQEDLANFFSLRPSKAKICSEQYPRGRYVAAKHLRQGDIFRVEESEVLAADGFITFEIRAEGVGEDSVVGQMIAIMEKALGEKTPFEGKTERALQWFVPVIIALGVGTGFVCLLSGLTFDQAMIRAVTVMVISCPCTLGIAIPMARVAGISLAGRKGILVRDFISFEQADRVDAFVLDKTGTVTKGQWSLREIIALDSLSGAELLALAAALETESDHLIAAEITREAARRQVQPLSVEGVEVSENGISGTFDDEKVRIGSREFLARELKASPDLAVGENKPEHSPRSCCWRK
jgi:Cu2+-exporting ATPase/Cu+-exporting ATPase